MPTTVTVMAPNAYQSFQTSDGSSYTADINRRITGVSIGPDLQDLINGGCKLLPDIALTPRLSWKTGRYYANNPGDTLAGILAVAGKVYAYPMYVPNQVSVTSLSVKATVGQTGGVGRVAIYGDNNGAPGYLISDGGEVTGLTTNGAVATANLALTPVTLYPGWYWFASAFNATTTLPTIAGATAALASGVNAQIGATTADNALATAAANTTAGIIANMTYGAFPSIFPTDGFALQVNATTPVVAVGV